MKVNVKCFSSLSKEGVCDYHGSKPHEIEDRATVKDLVKKLELDPEKIKLIFVNHKEVPMETVLAEGDQVAMAPKSGGM